MPGREARWGRVEKLTAAEKAAIATACEHVISDTLRPRLLPQIVPTDFNFPIDIIGRWRGSKYTFVTRFRSGFADSLGWEFDAPFARLDHLDEMVGERRFNVMWHRHTGQWWLLHRAVTLADALHLVETDGVLRPPI